MLKNGATTGVVGLASVTLQGIVDEVRCLEIDGWKEWRALASVQCLLGRTRERNAWLCDESNFFDARSEAAASAE